MDRLDWLLLTSTHRKITLLSRHENESREVDPVAGAPVGRRRPSLRLSPMPLHAGGTTLGGSSEP